MADVTLKDKPNPHKATLREQEDALDARASTLDVHTDIGLRETFKIIWRGMLLLRFFWGRYLIKWVLNFIALAIPVTILPWPLKIVIDHVVLGRPIAEATGYPFFMQPLLDALQGLTPFEIMVVLTTLAVTMVILVGAYAPSGAANDTTESGLEEGHDNATKTENKLHEGHSFSGGLYGYFEFHMNMRLTQSVNHLIRSKLFEKIHAMPMTKLEDQRIGDAVYRVMYDTPSITFIFHEVIRTPTLSITTFMFGVLTMWSAYPNTPEIIWFAMALFPFYLLVTLPFTRMMRRRSQAARAAGTVATSTIEEGMDNVLAVQSLGGNEKEKARFGEDSGESFKRYRGVVLVGIIIASIGGFVEALLLAVVFLFITTQVIDGVMSPGDFGALLFYYGWMRGPMVSMSTLWIRLQENVAGMRRVFALMDMEAEEEMGDKPLSPIQQGVTFQGVGLTFPDGRRALNDINLEAQVGKIVALVGPTGAGKTSLAYLIPRYRVASEGRVLIDGQDVTELTMQSLRSQITYVFQETQLFSDSIIDNIRYGKPEATQEEVERVAQVAGV
ncbi:MAG: ABC transporter ATP-binding protein, partial [Pseudomonadota bacterium]